MRRASMREFVRRLSPTATYPAIWDVLAPLSGSPLCPHVPDAQHGRALISSDHLRLTKSAAHA